MTRWSYHARRGSWDRWSTSGSGRGFFPPLPPPRRGPGCLVLWGSLSAPTVLRRREGRGETTEPQPSCALPRLLALLTGKEFDGIIDRKLDTLAQTCPGTESPTSERIVSPLVYTTCPFFAEICRQTPGVDPPSYGSLERLHRGFGRPG